MWTFRCYLNEAGEDEIDKWITNDVGRSKKVLAKFLDRLTGLKDQPQHNWNGTRTKQLQGYDGLIEIRFKAADVQYRPIGCFGPGRRDFTILIGAKEVGGKFVPRDAPQKAQDRKRLIETDRERTRECF